MSASGLHIVSRRSAYDLNIEQESRATALIDAYHVIMYCTDSDDISSQGLDLAARIQKRLCDQYNAILLKGWTLQ
jgi:hypothetical protein